MRIQVLRNYRQRPCEWRYVAFLLPSDCIKTVRHKERPKMCNSVSFCKLCWKHITATHEYATIRAPPLGYVANISCGRNNIRPGSRIRSCLVAGPKYCKVTKILFLTSCSSRGTAANTEQYLKWCLASGVAWCRSKFR